MRHTAAGGGTNRCSRLLSCSLRLARDAVNGRAHLLRRAHEVSRQLGRSRSVLLPWRGPFFHEVNLPYEEPAKNLYQPGREVAADRAKAWTAHQAERLHISPEAVSVAIKRGWLPAEIDSATTALELLLDPPARDGLKAVR